MLTYIWNLDFLSLVSSYPHPVSEYTTTYVIFLVPCSAAAEMQLSFFCEGVWKNIKWQHWASCGKDWTWCTCKTKDLIGSCFAWHCFSSETWSIMARRLLTEKFLNVETEHQWERNVSWLLLPDGLVWIFQVLLMYWEFPTLTPLWFSEWPCWMKMHRWCHRSLVTTKVCRKAYLNAQHFEPWSRQ